MPLGSSGVVASGAAGSNTEISSTRSGSSSGATGAKRGSSRAAATVISRTTSPRRRSRTSRRARPFPSGPSSPPAGPTSTGPPAPTARRGASPRESPRGFAPRPSLPAPPPSYSVAAARDSRHTPPGVPRPARGPPQRRDNASGIHPTQPVHRRHATHRDDVGGDAGVHLVLLRRCRDLVEGAHHDALEPTVHSVFVPEIAAAVLHPLEVAHRHAAGVREDVGNDENTLPFEDLIGGRGGGTVRALANDFRLDLRGVLSGDDVLGSGGFQHVAVHRVGP